MYIGLGVDGLLVNMAELSAVAEEAGAGGVARSHSKEGVACVE